jgi:ribosome-associated protein
MGQTANQTPKENETGPDPEVELAARTASDKKAQDIVGLDLRHLASFTDYFLICTGNNARHVQSIADSVEEDLRKVGRRPLHTEGYSAAEWILLDYGDFIMHVFSATSRKFYDLERLWRDATRVELPSTEDPGSPGRA